MAIISLLKTTFILQMRKLKLREGKVQVPLCGAVMSAHICLLPKLALFPWCQLIVPSGTCQDAGWNPSSTTFQLGHTEKPLYFSVPVFLVWEMALQCLH